MSSRRFEAFLVQLYTDEVTRRKFLADPRAVASQAGLEGAEVEALVAIDRVGLELAARSFAFKRAARASTRRWWARWLTRRRRRLDPPSTPSLRLVRSPPSEEIHDQRSIGRATVPR